MFVKFFILSFIYIFCAGITIASFCYLQFFPPPYDTDGMYLRVPFLMLSLCGFPFVLCNSVFS